MYFERSFNCNSMKRSNNLSQLISFSYGDYDLLIAKNQSEKLLVGNLLILVEPIEFIGNGIV